MNEVLHEALNAAYTAGLADGSRQKTVLAAIHQEYSEKLISPTMRLSDGGPIGGHATSAAITVESLSNAKIANSKQISKKKSGTRATGVKEGILSILKESDQGLSAIDIIHRTGFKATSVNGTLMSLKKAGMVINENKLWSLATPMNNGVGEGAELVA